jgi:hypothetical protein
VVLVSVVILYILFEEEKMDSFIFTEKMFSRNKKLKINDATIKKNNS